MRKPLLLLLLAALAAGFAPAPFPRPERRRTDLEKMQGTWVLDSMLLDGRTSRRGGTRVTIEGDRLKYVNDGKVGVEYVLTLSPSQRPREYVSRQVGTAVIFQGLYSVQGHTLKFAYNGSGESRPTAFEGMGRGRFLEVYKRIAP